MAQAFDISLYSALILLGALGGALVPLYAGREQWLARFVAFAGGVLLGTAFAGLSLHTLFDGVALRSAVVRGVGLMAFVAIAAHKVPSSLSLAAILKAEGRGAGGILFRATGLGLMVPVGAGLYFGLDQALPLASLAAHGLAFSSGSFLYVAASELLPHFNRHRKPGGVPSFLALGLGVAVMAALTLLSGHPHPAP